jgi:hypothetical protein
MLDSCGIAEQGPAVAWWIHDHLPYSILWFFPNLLAVNIRWREEPERRIDSYAPPRGCLTKPGMHKHGGVHGEWYEGIVPGK